MSEAMREAAGEPLPRSPESRRTAFEVFNRLRCASLFADLREVVFLLSVRLRESSIVTSKERNKPSVRVEEGNYSLN